MWAHAPPGMQHAPRTAQGAWRLAPPLLHAHTRLRRRSCKHAPPYVRQPPQPQAGRQADVLPMTAATSASLPLFGSGTVSICSRIPYYLDLTCDCRVIVSEFNESVAAAAMAARALRGSGRRGAAGAAGPPLVSDGAVERRAGAAAPRRAACGGSEGSPSTASPPLPHSLSD